MLKDKVLVVGGVSKDINKYGHKIFHDLLHNGYHVYGISREEWKYSEGITIYNTLEKVPEPIDILITVTPPEFTKKLIEKAYELKVPLVWMQPGSENEEVITLSKSLPMAIHHHECIMKKEGIW